MNVLWRRLGHAVVAASIVLILSNYVGALEETIVASTIQIKPIQVKTDASSCEDQAGKFFIEGIEQLFSCTLITKQRISYQVFLCEQNTGEDGLGVEVFNNCPNTCANVGIGPCAPSASPSESPSDSPSASGSPSVSQSEDCENEKGKFSVKDINVMVSCTLLSFQSDPIVKNVCQRETGEDGGGEEVSQKCRKTCARVGIGPCAPTASPSSAPTVATFANFIDVSHKIAEYASQELANRFAYTPWPNFVAVAPFDVNGDGYADMLRHQHIDYFFVEGDPVGSFWDLSTSFVDSNNEVRYNAGKVDVTYESTGPFPYLDWDVFKIFERCLNYTSIIEEVSCVNYADFHGFIILDFDRDGTLDYFTSIGGGSGKGVGIGIESMLFWGENITDAESSLRFRGGRKALIDAGLSTGEPQRTYGLYAADFNRDGYLDFFIINHYRVEDLRAPGHIYMSRGASNPRKFDIHPEVSEFSNGALLTDFDQDGFAHEFLVLQKPCFLVALGDENCFPEPKCVVYKWNDMGSFEKIWTSDPFPPGTEPTSVVSGDFNRDGLTDIVLLWKKGARSFLRFWYSSEENVMLDSATDLEITNSACRLGAKPRHSIRAADFDLDGRLDILVMCNDATGSIFTQSPLNDNVWEPIDTGFLGPLASREQIGAPAAEIIDQCFGDNPGECTISDDPEFLEEWVELFGDGSGEGATPAGQGVTIFDYNNDGFPDIFWSVKNGVNFLLENEGISGNNFLSMKLKGTTSNLDGIGAIIKLYWKPLPDSETQIQLWEHSCQTFETDPHGGRDSRIVFGLGNQGVPLKLEVRWPSGKISIVEEEELKEWPMVTNYNEITIITEP